MRIELSFQWYYLFLFVLKRKALKSHGQATPWKLVKSCEVISDTLDHVVSQSVMKTSIRQTY